MLRVLGLAAAAAAVAASAPHYDSVALKRCLISEAEAIRVTPLATSGFGTTLPRRIQRRVLVALFLSTTRVAYRFSPYVFFAFGRDEADARRNRGAVRRAVSRLLPPTSAGAARLNVAWFAAGPMPANVFLIVDGCLDQAKRFR